MKLIRPRSPKQVLTASVATIGNFDGLHRGHQALIAAMNAMAKSQDLPSVLISFHPLPKEFFSKRPGRLMSITEKIIQLKHLKVDYFYCIPFNAFWSHMSAPDFMREVLQEALGAKHLFVGEDFRFGYQRLGGISQLRSFGERANMQVHVAPETTYHHTRISSSWLRNSLIEGKLERASALLGSSYAITGRVIHGAKLGRKLGFPTINIALRRRGSVLSGVYVARVHIKDQVFFAAASVGVRPAVCGREMLLEAHLLDFNQEIYGQRVTIVFLQKLRDEWDFPDLASLCRQIQRDVEKTQQYCLNHGGLSFTRA